MSKVSFVKNPRCGPLRSAMLVVGCLLCLFASGSKARATDVTCRVALVGSSADEVLTEFMVGDRIRVTAVFPAPVSGYVSTRILVNDNEPPESVFMLKRENGLIRESGSIGIGLDTQSSKSIRAKATDSVTIRVVGDRDPTTGRRPVYYEMRFPVVAGRRAITRPQLPAIQVASNSTPMAATCILLDARLRDLRATQTRYAAAERSLESRVGTYLEAQSRLRDDPTELISVLEALGSRADKYKNVTQSLEGARRGLTQAQEMHDRSVEALATARSEVYINRHTLAPAEKGDRNAVLARGVIESRENVIDGAQSTLADTTDPERRRTIQAAIDKRIGEVAGIRKTIDESTVAHQNEVDASVEYVELKREDLETEKKRFADLGEHAERKIVDAYRQARSRLAGFEQAAREVGFVDPPRLAPATSVTEYMGSDLGMRAQLLRNLRHAQVSAIAPSAGSVREARELALTEQMRLVALAESVVALKAVGAQQASDAVTKIGHADSDAILKSLRDMQQELGFYQKFYASMNENAKHGEDVAKFLATDAKGKQWMGGMVGKLKKIAGPTSQALDATDKTAKIAELAIVLEKGNERDALKAMATFFDLASSAPGFGGLIGSVMDASKTTALKADALVTRVTSEAIQRESRLLYDRADAKLYRKNEIQAITNRTVTEELVTAVQLRRLQFLLKQ